MKDKERMKVALAEAEKAMQKGELPIGSALFASGELIAVGQTRVQRDESIISHGEIGLLRELRNTVWSLPRPLELYTNLEPCLMCVGACLQVGLERVVYGMRAAPDGGTRLAASIRQSGLGGIAMEQGYGEDETVDMMKAYVQLFPDSSGTPYVLDMLAPYRS